jgi:type IV pilus assembly protein PilM
MPLEDMKKALKINSAPYLHQQYTNFNFDCYVIPPRAPKQGETAPNKSASKLQVLVGGASTQDVLLCRDSMLSAGLVPMAINLAPVAVINAFESAEPQRFQEDTVALVDIGYENSVISIVNKGQAMLTRAIPFGGLQITGYIAKTLSVDEKAAEEEKLKMSEATQVLIASCLSVFAHQLRSSIDFFERQHEVPVKKVFCSGGTALSAVILQFLTDEVGLPCSSWDTTASIEKELKNQKDDALKEQAANFAVAVGTATAVI